MARSAFLWIENSEGSSIRGGKEVKDPPLPEKFEGRGGSSVSSEGRLGTIECHHFEMAGESFFNSQTGEQTGTRQFRPVVIHKLVDNTSPLLWRALSDGWVFKSTFKFYDYPAGDTDEKHFYTVTLGQARVVGMRMILPTTSEETQGNPLPPMEEIKMIFGDVAWESKVGEDGTMAETSWKGKS